ncbi:hypothetical protein AMV131 [Betaentomopoxvirus amoorei]|uniref:AMV131 n=1 Tax=Amsacta moorei entomopoxvirus TaxID=28321 RepID=Q9EMR8_AMEPV|nr:hypothetical protein AMV131 [Amsacta moorei entomopoxvirus]AAG02837.1 AMV131 [Amsacta moorei entomopoxvirus]
MEFRNLWKINKKKYIINNNIFNRLPTEIHFMIAKYLTPLEYSYAIKYLNLSYDYMLWDENKIKILDYIPTHKFIERCLESNKYNNMEHFSLAYKVIEFKFYFKTPIIKYYKNYESYIEDKLYNERLNDIKCLLSKEYNYNIYDILDNELQLLLKIITKNIFIYCNKYIIDELYYYNFNIKINTFNNIYDIMDNNFYTYDSYFPISLWIWIYFIIKNEINNNEDNKSKILLSLINDIIIIHIKKNNFPILFSYYLEDY